VSGDAVPTAVVHVVPPSSEYWYEVIGSPPAEPAAKLTETKESPTVMPVSVGAAGRAIAVTAWSGFETGPDPAALVATTPMK